MKTESNLRQLISDGISLAADMGPRWAASRVYQTARRRFLMQRRLPLESWNRRPLADWLRPGIPVDPVRYVQWRETGAGKFFFDELPQPDLFLAISQQGAVSQADALLSGWWLYFGMLSVRTGFPPDWFRNSLT